MFGVLKHKLHFNLVNHITNNWKASRIYWLQNKKIKPDFNICISHIEKIQSVELSITQRRGALAYYYVKWMTVKAQSIDKIQRANEEGKHSCRICLELSKAFDIKVYGELLICFKVFGKC